MSAKDLLEARARAPGTILRTRLGEVHALVEGSGPAVVLVHGVTESAATFTELQHSLARTATGHAIDLPGHGYTDFPPEALRLDEMAHWIDAYLEAAHVERAVVVGWSMGGGVALELAIQCPARVGALVLLGTVGATMPVPLSLGLLRFHGIGELMVRLVESPVFRRALLRDTAHASFTRHELAIDRYWDAWHVRGRVRYLRRLLRAGPRPARGSPRRGRHADHPGARRSRPPRADRRRALDRGTDPGRRAARAAAHGPLAAPRGARGGARGDPRRDPDRLRLGTDERQRGNNLYGQLSDGSTTHSTTAVDTSYSGFVEVSAGDDFTCARRNDGGVWCWGLNSVGQLGDGSTDNRATPLTVAAASLPAAVVQLSAGETHVCARLIDGRVACWGDNSYGQLGDGTGISHNTPTLVPGLAGIAEITAGIVNTCARKFDGTVTCWGDNEGGLLGDGTSIQRDAPVTVAISNVAGLTLGMFSIPACAVLHDATSTCWGTGGSLPQLAATAPSGVAQFCMAGNDAFVRTLDGGVRGWGVNGIGQLGDGTTTDATTFVPVLW